MNKKEEELKIKSTFKENLNKNLEDFSNCIKNGTKDAKNFIDINHIESCLSKFVENNVDISLHVASDLLQIIDEKELIKLKKKNS